MIEWEEYPEFYYESEAVSGKGARRFLLASRIDWSFLIWQFMLVLVVYVWSPLSLLLLQQIFHVLPSSKICCHLYNENLFHSLIFQYFLASTLRCAIDRSPNSLPPPVFVLQHRLAIWYYWLFTFSYRSMETDKILQVYRTSGSQLERWITHASKHITISTMLVFTLILPLLISSLHDLNSFMR